MENLENIKAAVARNLRVFRELRGFTQKQLADILGVKHNAVSNWENGVNSIDIETLFRICDIFKVSINDMYGVSDQWNEPNTMENVLLLEKYKSLDAHGKKIVDAVLDLEYERYQISKAQDEQAITTVTREMIPVYHSKAAAGSPLPMLTDTWDNIRKDISTPKTADFGVVISGDSMEPECPDGCTVWVEARESLESGDIGVFSIAGEALCKKIVWEGDECRLVSLNPKYAPIKVTEEMDMHIHGKVIGHTGGR